MKICIEGNGSFGSFLRELLSPEFLISDSADSVILAVPLSTYDHYGDKHKGKHLVNVCSVQSPSTDILLKHTPWVTSIHPLFGRRTPSEFRNSILTKSCCNLGNGDSCKVDEEFEFIRGFKKVSSIFSIDQNGKEFTPESHDILMAKTHLAAVLCAKQSKVLLDRTNDIPDTLIPHSFRLLRNFVKTLEDMPAGTMESILANRYG